MKMNDSPVSSVIFLVLHFPRCSFFFACGHFTGVWESILISVAYPLFRAYLYYLTEANMSLIHRFQLL